MTWAVYRGVCIGVEAMHEEDRSVTAVGLSKNTGARQGRGGAHRPMQKRYVKCDVNEMRMRHYVTSCDREENPNVDRKKNTVPNPEGYQTGERERYRRAVSTHQLQYLRRRLAKSALHLPHASTPCPPQPRSQAFSSL